MRKIFPHIICQDFLSTVSYTHLLPTFEMQDMLSVAILYLLPFLFLHLLSERWFRSEQLENVKYELNNLKASDSVFLSQLELQPHYDVNPAISQIVWGCPQAKLRLSLIHI